MVSTPKTVAFFGASTGIGLFALKHTLAAGYHCIALCRNPSKLAAILPTNTTPNLKIVQGNAHDAAAVSRCLQRADGNLVDAVVSTIGGAFIMSRLTLDDPEVCRKGAATLVEALTELRRRGATGNPHLIAVSTTGMSRFGRDIPLLMIPLYYILLRVPHADKIVMEDRLAASQEAYTIVRASWLTGGQSDRKIRVGIEDPKSGRIVTAIGYTISREDAGRWIADNLVLNNDARYSNKIATITY